MGNGGGKSTVGGARRGIRCGLVWAATLGLLVSSGGCPSYGVIDDGTSVSWGPANHGKLMNPKRLPKRGEGYHIPKRWADRGLNWATDEMVSLLAYVGRHVRAKHAGASVSVADLSLYRGGPSQWHRSHQSGRDVDLLFFVTDLDHKQRSVRAYQDMRHVGRDGKTLPGVDELGQPLPIYRFDVARNWTMIRAAIHNPVARVQYIFVYDPLRQMLLEHARAIGESADIRAQAAHILRQPGGAAPHDDHFHMRIYCARSDRDVGCVDYGPLRWTKRDRKYVEGSRFTLLSSLPLDRSTLSRIPAMLSLSSLPFRGFVPK